MRCVSVTSQTAIARHERLLAQLRALDGGLADLRRVVGHEREVVLGMERHHAPVHGDGAPEGQLHVAERDRHGVTVDEHEAVLRVDDDAGAGERGAVDAVDAERHVEAHGDERVGEPRARAGPGRQRAAPSRQDRRPPRRRRRELAAGEAPGDVVADAAPRREPAPIDAQHGLLRQLRPREVRPAHAHALAVRQRRASSRSSASRSGTGTSPISRITARGGMSARANA